VMLKSYEAILDHGHLRWLGDEPDKDFLRVIVTVVEEKPSPHSTEATRAVLEKAWAIVNPPKSLEEIDQDIEQMRSEWNREWDR